MQSKADGLTIFSLYTEAPFSTRFFLFLRLLLTPYSKMAAELPKSGQILDQGCGHGLFSLKLAFASKDRKVLGVDHDVTRVNLASQTAKQISNLEFQTGSLLTENKAFANCFEGVALIDVLHYFTKEEQLSILKNSHSMLKSGGVVIFREVNPDAGIVSKINFFWEKLATLSKFTKSDNEVKLAFRLPHDWENLLREAGFKNVTSKSCSSFIFADVLFRGEKQ